MNYHNINHCDMLNGNGIRVSLWVSGCSVRCKGCQNQQTWELNSGIPFDEAAKQELFDALDKPYIKGITLTGGHPLEPENIQTVYSLLQEVKNKFPQKDVWLYTGYTLDILNFTTIQRCIHYAMIYHTLNLCDVVVDGPYIEEQRDITLPFCGSKNQRLIDVKETIKQGSIIQYKVN